jgi:hypothetical protein
MSDASSAVNNDDEEGGEYCDYNKMVEELGEEQ